ncbi:hypothetical protein SSX86_023529 [Deinandra increscens subsp. villosa]|uniref:Uncharacterized protein n=1 Tax=Deinandra increscens subsp. villosa TaxID=3103831 RepID=A0AAP0CR76_9ASTR
MLHCLRPSQPGTADNLHSHRLPFQGNSSDITSRSGSQASTILNVTNEYTSALQTSSYSEIRVFLDIETERPGEITQDQLLAQVLRPNRDFVEDILQHAKPGFITDLLWSFFDHSENKARVCLDLTQAIRRAHTLIAPLQDLLHVLPLDSETESLSSAQCNRAFELLQKYEQLENPFPSPGSRNLSGMRSCFTDLNTQLESLIKKSNSRVYFLHWVTIGSAVGLIGITIGVVIAGVIIAKHAFIALAAVMFLPAAIIPSKIEKKEQYLLQQLDAAQRGTFVLHEDIITIERLVNHLYSDIEVNKRFIGSGLWRGKDMHSIMEVSRQLKRNNIYFLKQLTDLEEHLCLSFAAINRARAHLIQIINLHQPASFNS